MKNESEVQLKKAMEILKSIINDTVIEENKKPLREAHDLVEKAILIESILEEKI